MNSYADNERERKEMRDGNVKEEQYEILWRKFSLNIRINWVDNAWVLARDFL